jgi:hypothetical protein
MASYYEWTDANWYENHRMTRKRHAKEVLRKTARLNQVIDQYAATGDEGWDFINAVGDLLDLYRREDRLPGMLPSLEKLPSTLFWDAWGVVWRNCDNTWSFNDRLVAMLRRHQHCSPARRYDDEEPLAIYRGCQGARVYGVSWTTNREVALWFAAGHHGLKMIEPVIASATVDRHDVFDNEGCWDEDEIVVDPGALCDLTVISFEPPSVLRHPCTGIEYRLTASGSYQEMH